MNAHLLFSTNNIPGSVIIRWATWSRFSHVDIVVSEDSVIGATLFGGVHEYPLDERLKKSRHWALYELPIDVELVAEEARKYLGRKYDWTGVLGVGFHRDWQEDTRWFCSELATKVVNDAMARVGKKFLSLDWPWRRITPQAMLMLPDMVLKHRQ